MVAKHETQMLHPGFEPGPDRYAIGPPAVQAAEEEEDDSFLAGILPSLDCRWNLQCTDVYGVPPQNQDSLWKII